MCQNINPLNIVIDSASPLKKKYVSSDGQDWDGFSDYILMEK